MLFALPGFVPIHLLDFEFFLFAFMTDGVKQVCLLVSERGGINISAFNYDCVLKTTFATFALAFHSGGTNQIFNQSIKYSFSLKDLTSDMQFYCCTCFYFLP